MLTKLSIIIPAFNEERTIHLILDKVRDVQLRDGIQKEVIIVNDGSTDGTVAAVERYMAANPGLDIRFIQQPHNMGKGAAIHRGIKEATGEYLIVQDADLEYDPREYNDLLRPVVEGFADVVYGSRFMGHHPHRILFFWHSIGNKFLTQLSNTFNNLNLTDMETCYKLIRTDIAQGLDLKEKRFGFEPEVTAKLARVKGIRIYEVGISYYGRTYAEGKKIGWKDGFRAIWCILKYGLQAMGQGSLRSGWGTWGALVPAVISLAALVAIRASTAAQPEIGDGALHYLQALHAWKHPSLFLDNWAKPLFVLLASPFAQLGFWGLALFNAVVALFTMVVIMRHITDSATVLRWAVPVLLLISPQYLFMVYSGMTEPLFGLLAVLVVGLLRSGRVTAGMLLASLLPFSRPEAAGLLPFVALWAAWNGHWRKLPLLACGPFIYAVFTWLAYGDFLWILHEDPYLGNTQYGHGDWSHFLQQAPDILGLPLLMLLTASFLAWPFVWHHRKEQRKALLDTLVLTGLPVVAIWFLHSYAWWNGHSGSAGYLRVFATTVPLSVLFILGVASTSISGLKKSPGKAVRLAFAAGCWLLLLPLGIKDVFGRVPLPPVMVAEQLQTDRAASYVRGLERPGGRVAYLYPYFGIVTGKDPWDSTGAVNLSVLPWSRPGAGLAEHDILVWDSHFGPNESAIPIQRILDDGAFTLQRMFLGMDGWNDTSPFSVWVFERKDATRQWTTDTVFAADLLTPSDQAVEPGHGQQNRTMTLSGWDPAVYAQDGPIPFDVGNDVPLFEVSVTGDARLLQEGGTWHLVLRVMDQGTEMYRQRLIMGQGPFDLTYTLPHEFGQMALDLRPEYAAGVLEGVSDMAVLLRKVHQVPSADLAMFKR
ncbi:MAG: glycosyltransferase family 2 protein [Flavobacteriales bacterium]|nr:glycosyltransferase family 2 protein [Flavobacteriales bacterium]